MFLDDLVDVCLGSGSVPGVVRVDHHGRALATGIQAAGFVGAHFAFQTQFVDAFFGVVKQSDGATRRTAASGVVLVSLIIADEQRLLKAAHGCSGGGGSVAVGVGQRIEMGRLVLVEFAEIDIAFLAAVGEDGDDHAFFDA